MMIDVDKLREDMRNEGLAGFFGGGFGGALIEAIDVDRASDKELVDMALKQGIDLRRYEVDE